MTNDFDSETAKTIILDDENVNVSVPNPFKDLIQVCINLILIIAFIYLFAYTLSGIIISTMPIKKQIAVENFIAKIFKLPSVEISFEEQQRLNQARDKILKLDSNYPKTSNLNIKIVDKKELNAFCYPNGNIYITSSLFKELKNDELIFIIAHEMAHYKHKDHLKGLRRNISNMIVIYSVAFGTNNKQVSTFTEQGLQMSDLKLSRNDEKQADMYASEILLKLYGKTNAGVSVMQKLKKENEFNIEFLSDHPDIDKRIKYIKNYAN